MQQENKKKFDPIQFVKFNFVIKKIIFFFLFSLQLIAYQSNFR